MIVGGCHDDTCKNLEDTASLAGIHAFPISQPIKQDATMHDKK